MKSGSPQTKISNHLSVPKSLNFKGAACGTRWAIRPNRQRATNMISATKLLFYVVTKRGGDVAGPYEREDPPFAKHLLQMLIP